MKFALLLTVLLLAGFAAAVGTRAQTLTITTLKDSTTATVGDSTVTVPATIDVIARTADMSLDEFRERRRAKKRYANRIRHHKFRSALVFYRTAGWFKPYRRSENLRLWRHKVDDAIELSPHPLATAARYWWNNSGASCVKGKEGAWTSDTGNDYYGGFQADISFQTTYGFEFYQRWGTANHWRPIYQKIMAYRGYLARGWYPWPKTARACGLL